MPARPVDLRRHGAPPVRPAAVTLSAVCLALAVTRAASAVPDAALDTPVSAIWTGLPLRAWADRATGLAGRPVILDRRLDPETPVTRDCRGESLGDVLTAVAAAAGATVEPLQSWIRIGPRESAGRATRGEQDRAADIERLPASARDVLASRRPWSWHDGARPRDLVAEAASAAGVTLSGVEAVPHDHLPAATLPPLTLAERLDLVLADYDLRVAWEATAAGTPGGRLVPLADGPAPAPPVRRPGRERVQAPGKRPRPNADQAAQRYTLTLEAPLEEALRALAPRLELEPEIDRGSLAARGVLPGEIVRARVNQVTRDELLDALVAPLGLRWRIEGTRLLVDAPPP